MQWREQADPAFDESVDAGTTTLVRCGKGFSNLTAPWSNGKFFEAWRHKAVLNLLAPPLSYRAAGVVVCR